MNIYDIDYYSLNGDTLLHKTSTGLKLLWSALLIFLVVAVDNIDILLAVYLGILVYIVSSKLPAKIILPLSFYPLIFASIFVFSASEITVSFALVIILKVLIAASTVILLFLTTSYKSLFIKLSSFLPGFLTTALFLTYRAFFILWKVLEDIMRALKLRGGISFKDPKRSFNVLGNVLGLLVIRSIDTSENMYNGMRLRGHSADIKFLDDKKWKK